MQISLDKLMVSQWNLNRVDQIKGIIDSIKNGEYVDPINVSELGDDIFRIEDGNHRAVAYFLSGRLSLNYGEFNIVPFNASRNTVGLLKDLVAELLSKGKYENKG